MNAPLLSLHHATVRSPVDDHTLLDDVSCDIHRGDWLAVAGANGSGKSTLLALLAGIVPPASGRRDTADPALHVAVLLQDPDNQLVASRVRQELALSMAPDAPDRAARIGEAVERFSLGHVLDRHPHRLSGGEKQRLAMATVWLERPGVVLLDEPLSYLDATHRAQVIDFVREMNAAGTAVVWATPGEDLALARDAIVLDAGRVVYRGPARDAPVEIDHPAPAASAVTLDGAPGRTVVALQGVSFDYPGAPVFDRFDFSASAGECVGVMGPNSAGKSTLLLLAGGALRPSAGRVIRDTADVTYLPQSPERLFFAENVFEEIAFGLRRRGRARDDIRRIAGESLAAVGLDPARFLERAPQRLSPGEMRRVAFAMAAALESELLLLDEPTSCLDAAGHAVLRDVVAARRSAGAAVIVASHDAAHLRAIASRMVTLPGRGERA
jgi:energy-coupling factor transport system ATP-binding protein